MRFRLGEKLSSQIWAGHVNMKFALFGSIAQSVELRTHKPSVPSSSLGRATTINPALCGVFVFQALLKRIFKGIGAVQQFQIQNFCRLKRRAFVSNDLI
jgi:hypothetical protein